MISNPRSQIGIVSQIALSPFGFQGAHLSRNDMILDEYRNLSIHFAIPIAKGTLSRASVAITDVSARTAWRRSSLGLRPNSLETYIGSPGRTTLEKAPGAALWEVG